jgi:hyperosmotically inducible protein
MEKGAMKRAALLAAAGLSLTAMGCEAASNAAQGAGAFVEKTAQNIEQKTTDASIIVAVKGSLVKENESLGRTVSVGCLNGVVSLAGTAPTPEAKARAEEVALKVRGVTRVLNSIDVVPPK